ncbi:uncharacterized protein [Nicotiana tomentosiformis]|uniref:uncharacterized protein n=1 Tax=Nicotiana tomentosiformis TaxID=4098 RepID=UPI00051BA600|nr:uncharacterized protein LOC104094895 isoform X1 [Nicotiana tomentosiformis]
MAESCLMASHGYPPWLLFPPEQGISRFSKESLPFLPSPGANQDMVKLSCGSLKVNQRLDLLKPISMLLAGNHFVRIQSTIRRPVLVDVQDTHLNSVLFSFGIAEQCTRQEKIWKYLMAGSNDVESGGIDTSMLFDLVGPLAHAVDMHRQQFASYLEQQPHDAMSQPSLVYPSCSLHLWEPPLNAVSDLGLGKTLHSNSPLLVNGASARVEMKDILAIISEFYLSKDSLKCTKQALSKDSMKCTKQAMLVPYFDRCRMSKAKGESSAQKLDVNAASISSPRKTKYQTSTQKRSNKKAVKEQDIYRNNYLHACESLLSIMVDKKRHGKSAILSLKKSGPQLPYFLTKFSASIAGTGIAVLFSVACKLACGRIAFSTPKLLNTGLGLGLVWLSWAVNNLRDTVVVINRSPGKLDMVEEDMMNNLDKNVKEIYFRAATLLAVVVLRLA